MERKCTGASNPDLCGSFFKLLERAIDCVKELSCGKKLTPDQILNVDKIGFNMNFTAG